MRKLKIKKVSFSSAKKLFNDKKVMNQSSHVREVVQKIILDVKKNGDKALIKISNKLDNTKFKSIY